MNLFLLCSPLGFAQSSTSASNEPLLNATNLTEVMKSLVKKPNSVRFTIQGHQVIGLMDEITQKIQLIYIFPKNPGAADCKVKLAQAVEDVQQFFSPNQSAFHTYTHDDDLFAQIRMDANPSIDSSFFNSSTTNLVLFMLKAVGSPSAWKDNRLIWKIHFNNNRSHIEIAVDIWGDKVESIDFVQLDTPASDKTLIELFNRIFGIKLRTKKSSKELSSWQSYTGFSASMIIGAAPSSALSDSINSSSLFLIKKKNIFRLAKKDILRQSNRDATTWVQSGKVAFPSKVEDLATIAKSYKSPLATTDTSSAAGANKATTYATPGIALEYYIRQLNAK